LDREISTPGAGQKGGRNPEEEEDCAALLSFRYTEDHRDKISDREEDRSHQEDDRREPEEGGVEGSVCSCIVLSLEVDGEESGDGGVEGLDYDRNVAGDRGRQRDEAVGSDPEGVDEVGNQEDADDDVH